MASEQLHGQSESDTLNDLATRCEEKAVLKVKAYLSRGRISSYDGSDYLDDADKLLRIAASLKARARKEGDRTPNPSFAPD